MVRGGIHLHGRTPHHLVQDNLTGVTYFVLHTLQAMGPGAMLQDDNAPDMAPTEHLWDILGCRVHDNHPQAINLAQLFQFLQQEWNAIPQRNLVTLVQPMRRRCVECLGANGGFTYY